MKIIDNILPFAPELIYEDGIGTVEKIITRMMATGASQIPIIGNNGTRNMGVVRRKMIWEAMIRNKGALPETKTLLEDPLPAVCKDTELSELMEKLNTVSGVLFQNDDHKHTHFISPRVVSKALKCYSTRFRAIEKLEHAIRLRLEKFPLEEIETAITREGGREFPEGEFNLEALTFAEYQTAIAVLWERLGMEYLDRGHVVKLLNTAREYRNSVMHFRLSEGDDGLDSVVKLEKLFGSHS